MELHTARDLFRIDPQTEDIQLEDGGALNLSFEQRPIPSFTNPDFTQNPCGDGLCFFNVTNGTNNGSFNTGDLDGTFNWWALAPAPFVIFGITGNLLVCLAIALEKKLQNVTNYFLFSLAVTDLLVSLIVMPFSILHEFRGYWSLSVGLCNFYVTSDVMMCTASIMHLCTISVDRYIGIRYPLQTKRNKSKFTVAVKLLIVWSLSLVVSSPITVLGIVDEHNLIVERRCVVNNDYFIIYGSIIAFFIPLVIMVVTNVLTMQLLNEQVLIGSQKKDEHCPMMRRAQGSRRINRNTNQDKRFPTPKINTTSNTTKTVPSTRKWAMDSNENRKLLPKAVSTATSKLDKGPSEMQSQGDTSGFSANSSPATPRPSRFRELIAKHNITSKAANKMLIKKDIAKENSVQTERKATKVLAIVFTIFVVSWAPFFTTNVITVLCKWCHVDNFLFVVFVWLGYISSTLNPIIYTIFNKTFKVTFIKLMICDYTWFGRIKRKVSLKSTETNTSNYGYSAERNHESNF